MRVPHLKMSIEAFILIGGASRRMGADKSRLVLGGQDAITRIVAALSAITSQVSTVGGAAASTESVPHVADIHPRWGALGGIHAALDACKSDWAAVVACDLPFVSGGLFTYLRDLAENDAGPIPDAVVPVQHDGRAQPLCALYRRAT